MQTPSLEIRDVPLTPHDVESVARFGKTLRLSPAAQSRLDAAHRLLQQAMQDTQPHYGVNTGFGALGRVRIDRSALTQLQVNLVRSHATGIGPALDRAVVRATMFLLVASLARGHSGVRPIVAERLVDMLNQDVIPVVPEIGSVGASGDLAPLSHIAQTLFGEGDVAFRGVVQPAGDALSQLGWAPVTLQAKEGLALINGTHLMAARAALIVCEFERLFDAAVIAAAMSIDASRATDATLDPRIHALRRQPGQQYVAQQLRECLAGSEIIRSHVENDSRVQDPYSFRCCPVVLGAVWDQFLAFRSVIENELGAVTDNPLIFERDGTSEVVSGGNFHGMPLAIPLDAMAIGISHLAGISERRIFHMLSGQDPEAELPTFLTPQAGLQSGLMIAQYTAAACCNELIGLATPASVANITTSAGMEDYNSFGPRSAAKAARGLFLARHVVAVELLCAATGLDHHRPLKSGARIEDAYRTIREQVPPLTDDRSPAPDIAAIVGLIEADRFTRTGNP